MAKLYFRYGTVNSGKSMLLLSVAHNYISQNKKILIMKPQIDTRTGDTVYSRNGFNIKADFLINENSDIISFVLKNIEEKINKNIEENTNKNIDKNIDKNIEINEKDCEGKKDYQNKLNCILVDEAQFLSDNNVLQLRFITTYLDIPVITYGLRTTYKGTLFTGSQALFCYADSIEEIKTTCTFCNKKAILNLKVTHDKTSDESNNKATSSNDKNLVDLGFEDKYKSVCYLHYFSHVE